MELLINILLIFTNIKLDTTELDENIDYCVRAINSWQDEEYLNTKCDIEKTKNYILNVKLWKINK